MYKGSAIVKLSFKRKASAAISCVALAATFAAVVVFPFFARIFF